MEMSFVISSLIYHKLQDIELLRDIIKSQTKDFCKVYLAEENFERGIGRVRINFNNPIDLLQLGFRWGKAVEERDKKNFVKKSLIQQKHLQRISSFGNNYKVFFEIGFDLFDIQNGKNVCSYLRKVIQEVNNPMENTVPQIKEEYFKVDNDTFYLTISFTEPLLLLEISKIWGQSIIRNTLFNENL